MPNAYFASVAPLVGIDFLSDSDTIISLFDSPTFQFITDLYLSAYQNHQLSESPVSFRLTDYPFYDTETSSYIPLDFNQSVYCNPSYNEGRQYISIRRDTDHQTETFDFVTKLTTNSEYARYFYIGDSHLQNEEGFFESIPLSAYRLRLLNFSVLLPTQKLALDTEDLNTLYQAVKPTPLTGFVFDTQPVQAEIQAVQQVLLSDDLLNQLEKPDFWSQWSENLIAFRDHLQRAGLSKIIDEANRQYQVWKVS